MHVPLDEHLHTEECNVIIRCRCRCRAQAELPFRSFTGTKCRYQDKRMKRAVFTPINGMLYLGAPSLHRVIQDLYFDCLGLFLFIFFMFFIVFPYDLCNIITLKFFYDFFNDLFHEFYLIKC